jgi:hypothetical protein
MAEKINIQTLLASFPPGTLYAIRSWRKRNLKGTKNGRPKK